MTDVLIKRELLERIDETAICDGTDTTISDDLFTQLVAALAAPRQTAGDPHKHEAQPEVAQNTGSRSMTNKLSSQGRTGCTGVEGVAAPCETPDAVDIFAWATFDGEGSHDLRLYEDNENYRDDFRAANPALHPDWVFPLCRLPDAQHAVAELQEERDTLRQQLAERDEEIERLQVFNKSLDDEAAERLQDVTEAENEAYTLRQQLAELREECERVKADRASCWAEFKVMTRSCLEAEAQRDKLAGLLRDERNWNCVEISCQRGVKDHCLCGACRILRIDAALAEVKPCPESLHPAAT